VNVDGSESHTHGVGLTLTNWTWTKSAQVLGRGETASFRLPVGTHTIALTVIDSGGNVGTETATVVVSSFGFPDISSLTPSSGSITGGNVVTITGTGFTYSTNQTIVHFGGVQFTGVDITILSSTTITVVAPLMPLSVPVPVSVETPLGRSDDATYTYTSSIPIAFTGSKLMDFADVTVGEFGPDGKLYVGTVTGMVGKITMNADYTAVTSTVTSMVQPGRAILGLTFDPMDAGALNPPVYITSSELFHGEVVSSSGKAINGKICRISGANLDVVTDVITGLPVSDLDHGTFDACK
jgi:IPT/TIG domain